jgi:hypothetical protein
MYAIRPISCTCYFVNDQWDNGSVLTWNRADAIAGKMGRKKMWSENINLSLPEGAKARMDSLLQAGEDRLDLIRLAIDREIRRREKALRTAGRSTSGDGEDHG